MSLYLVQSSTVVVNNIYPYLHVVLQSVAPFQRLLGVSIEPTPAQGPPYTFDFSNFVFEHAGRCNYYIIIFVLKKGTGGVGSALKFVKIDY